MIKHILILLFVPLLIFASTNDSRSLKKMKIEQRVALIIGNNVYKHDRLLSLKNPINDAKAMRKALKKLGFKIHYGENLTVRAMDKKLSSFSRELKKGGVGLFFFAGHGVEANGRNYLMGKDSNLDDKDDVSYESLELKKVLDKMQNSGNRLNIVLLDACRNDPFSRSGGGGLAKSTAKGTFIAYATSPGDVASDGNGKNGVFTSEVLKYINSPGVPIERVFKNVKAGVLNTTNDRQRPWTNSDIVGDFYFILPSGTPIKIQKKTATSSFSLDEEVPTTFDLTIDASPSNARVQITNIKAKYHDGIRLKKGSYNIKVSKSGYKTKKGKINLQTSMNIVINLEPITQKTLSKPISYKSISSSSTIDKRSALVWQEDISTKKYNWRDAKSYCSNLAIAGYKDWRLASINELKSILTKTAHNNSNSYSGKTFIKKSLLNSMQMGSQDFWSSTLYQGSSKAWYVLFDLGGASYNSKSNKYNARCVRSR